MKIKFTTKSGGFMWVDESRVEEYKAAGFTPATETPKPAKTPTKRKSKKEEN